MHCAACGTALVCPKCDLPTCPKCQSTIARKTNKSDGSKFWGCSRYPKCKWSDDDLPPPLPKKMPSPMDPLPEDFLEWVRAHYPEIFEAYDLEHWDNLFWLHEASKHRNRENVKAVVEEARSRDLLDKALQIRKAAAS